jgi:hypothetical protein
MSQLVEQSGYSLQAMQGLLEELKSHPEIQTELLHHVTNNGITDPQVIASLIEERLGGATQTINDISANAEASLVQGGFDAGVAHALTSPVGFGADKKIIEQAAANFAHEAQRAITNGQTLSEVRTADPNLSLQAQEAIYEQVANQQGTSSQEIEQKAEAAKQESMQMIQGAVFGAAAFASASPAAAFMSAPASEERPYGITADRMPFQDLGSTTAAIAAMEQFRPQAGLPTPQREREQGFSLA